MTARAIRMCVGLGAVLFAAPVGAEQPLSRTTPGHLSPVPPGGYELPMAPPVTQFPRRPQAIVLNADRPWRSIGRIDKDLSDACAARRFRERFNLQYRAIFERKDVLGVAFGDGTNLVDDDNKAEAEKIYLFRNGDSTNCLVLVLTHDEVLEARRPPATKAGTAKK